MFHSINIFAVLLFVMNDGTQAGALALMVCFGIYYCAWFWQYYGCSGWNPRYFCVDYYSKFYCWL
jgi:hypothetical protein